ncbi:MAG TPA: HD domain-containing protein [Candidatus Anoxymicrobiaceae bacterium]
MHNQCPDPDKALEVNRLFGLAAGMADSPGRFFACGDFVLESITGRGQEGLLIACGADTPEYSHELGKRAGLAPVELGGVPGGYHLADRDVDSTSGSITVIPLGDGIESVLSDTGFTVQALAVDLGASRPRDVIDPLGGLDDLRAGILRASSNDSFTNDPTRLLEATELCSRYGLELEESTLRRMRTDCGSIASVSPFRTWRHVARLFGGTGLSDKARLLKSTGVLGELLPEVEATFEVPQNYYHHLGVWEHTLEAMENLESMLESPGQFFGGFGHRVAARMALPVESGIDRRAYLGFAALIHDIGKPASMSVTSSGRIRFQGHQETGGRLAEGISSRMGLGRTGSRHLVGVVADHMRLGFLMKEGESAQTRLKVVGELGELTVEVVMLSLADRIATRGEASTADAMGLYRRMATRVLQDFFWDTDFPPLVDGHDAVVHAGIEPGPDVAKALFGVRVAQREAVITNRRQALEFMAPDFKGKMDTGGRL